MHSGTYTRHVRHREGLLAKVHPLYELRYVTDCACNLTEEKSWTCIFDFPPAYECWEYCGLPPESRNDWDQIWFPRQRPTITLQRYNRNASIAAQRLCELELIRVREVLGYLMKKNRFADLNHWNLLHLLEKCNILLTSQQTILETIEVANFCILVKQQQQSFKI
jgi:hypothetical protein